MEYVKLERIWLKDRSVLDEKWVQDRIDEDPSILGLGNDLIVRGRERRQPRAGRLDLLLEDRDGERRYEVEIQLGATDESHIIRAIEYWDIERKRDPNYKHCAVLVAEDVTSRFLNVISLFNGEIPFIAIQFQALKVGEDFTLVFTTVLDELIRGDEEDEDNEQPPADRAYWEQRGSKTTMQLADRLLEMVRGFDSALMPNYTKFYIGLVKNAQRSGRIQFVPQKSRLLLRTFLEQSQEIDEKLAQIELDFRRYIKKAYEFSLAEGDIEKHGDMLQELMRRAYERKPL